MSISRCDSFCLDCNKLSTGDHAPSTLIYASLGISAAVGRSYGRAKKREIKMGNTSGTLWSGERKGGGRRLTNARAVIFMIACCLFALFFFFFAFFALPTLFLMKATQDSSTKKEKTKLAN